MFNKVQQCVNYMEYLAIFISWSLVNYSLLRLIRVAKYYNLSVCPLA